MGGEGATAAATCFGEKQKGRTWATSRKEDLPASAVDRGGSGQGFTLKGQDRPLQM